MSTQGTHLQQYIHINNSPCRWRSPFMSMRGTRLAKHLETMQMICTHQLYTHCFQLVEFANRCQQLSMQNSKAHSHTRATTGCGMTGKGTRFGLQLAASNYVDNYACASIKRSDTCVPYSEECLIMLVQCSPGMTIQKWTDQLLVMHAYRHRDRGLNMTRYCC